MNSIKFGTDGWRAVIAKDYTYENLNIVSQATARWIIDQEITQNGVVIGYDARFCGKNFAEHTASVFAAMEIPVRMAKNITPTPAVSWGALHYNAIGVVITASHNPPEYNGFKIKAPFGGSATPGHIRSVEEKLGQYDSTLKVNSYMDYLKSGQIREIDLTDNYLNAIKLSIDLAAIKASGIKIGHDPMYGAGRNLIRKLLGDQVYEIHSEINPGFGGTAPEPIERNLKEFSAFIPETGCSIGIANDGDADRIGMLDEKGAFVDSHQILSLLIKYLSQNKGLKGTIVKTFSTTNMIEKQAIKYELPLEITPIGFKYVAEKIINGDVLVGGEESGGLAVKGHLPERDGIFIGLLVTEMMVKSGKKLSELVQELFDEFGTHATYRNDIHTEERKKLAMMEFCSAQKLKQINGHTVTEWQTIDGIKHILDNGSWLMVRPSGTEPVLRIYSEASTADEAKALVDRASEWVDRPEIFN